MDNEMIERVSKAILETPNASDYRTLVARNAIKAMREPTEKMVEAGSKIDAIRLEYDTWQAMIDVVINETSN